jgi:DNA-binding winged helix-turn-helix (wHTH) protein/Tol biopolymer transport system component
MSGQTRHFYDFSGYRLDPAARVLLRSGETVPVPPKAFDLLLVLVQNQTRVVEKDELLQAVWPDSFVEEGNLSQNVFVLRKALRETETGERHIITVSGRGYRFGSAVAEVFEEPAPAAAPPPRRTRAAWIAGGLSILVGASLGWYVLAHARERPLLKQTRLTPNSPELSVRSAAISPDGRSLAYADDHGISLRFVDSGETHPLPGPGDARIDFLSWSRDGSKLLASGVPAQGTVSCVWVISPPGNSVRQLRTDAAGAVASPDGREVLFTANHDSEIWSISIEGDGARRILVGSAEDAFSDLSWFPDGRRIAYVRAPVVPVDTIESCALPCGTPDVLVSASAVSTATLHPSGRLLYARAEADGSVLWDVSADLSTGRAVGPARRVFEWHDALVSAVTLSADGRRAVAVRGSPQADVAVGDLAEGGTALHDPRRLTLDDRGDWLSSWTADSTAVVFSSNRNAHSDVFRQELGQRRATPLVESTRDKGDAIFSPDGAFVLYDEQVAGSGSSPWDAAMRIARAPVSGGAAQTVLEQRGLAFYGCSRASDRCVMGVWRPQALDVYALDALRGKGARLATMDAQPDTTHYRFALSPDGATLASVSLQTRSGRIHLMPLAGGSSRDLEVSGWNDLHFIAWAPDGTGWYVSSETATATTILHVDRHGDARPLLRQPGRFAAIWSLPSPDGRHLAFVQYNPANNAWLLENF